MIIVDTALKRRQEEGNPVRVAVVGAGYMGRGMVLQIISSIPGMEVVAISNRTVATAAEAYHQAGGDRQHQPDRGRGAPYLRHR